MSTKLSGWTADHFGDTAAFMSFAIVGALRILLVWRALPETRPA